MNEMLEFEISNYCDPKLHNSLLEPAPRSALGIACVLRLVFEYFNCQSFSLRLIQRFLTDE